VIGSVGPAKTDRAQGAIVAPLALLDQTEPTEPAEPIKIIRIYIRSL
jgi:hypothetical protein